VAKVAGCSLHAGVAAARHERRSRNGCAAMLMHMTCSGLRLFLPLQSNSALPLRM